MQLMSYDNVYVAQCVMGAVQSQLMKTMKVAVASGYWNLYRYTPEDKVFHLDSKAPTEAERAAKGKYEYYRELAERK